MTETEHATPQIQLNPAQAHFWVCSYPFFETTLLVSSPAELHFQEARVYLYDPDGAIFNEVSFGCPAGELGVLELGSLLGACKIESGLKHAHLEVRTPNQATFLCRIHTNSSASLLGEPQTVSVRNTAFFPIVMAEGRNSMLAIVNHARSEARLRCRLYFGKRMPEAQVVVPPLGARVISLAAEFGEYKAPEGGRSAPAYLRVSSSSDQTCGVQVVEALSAEKGSYIFSSIS